MKRKFELFSGARSAGGLTQEEKKLLYLMPLIQTAWACGAVSPREKQVVFEAAREDLIDERDEINYIIDELLRNQPGRVFFDDCLEMISCSMKEMTTKERNFLRARLLRRCRDVAVSAGSKSLMDTDHHISEDERHLIESLREVLN